MKNSFYVNGLKFSCQRCSSCCRYEPGYVFISYHDLDNLCLATGFPKKQFVDTYCRVIRINGFQRVSLIEKENYDCIFWEKGGCVVYPYRPLQCRSFPFWGSHLYSSAHWNELETSCPGVNKGKMNSREVIERWLQKKQEAGFIKVKDGKIII